MREDVVADAVRAADKKNREGIEIPSRATSLNH
jgi:hypothetical protein